MTIVEKVRNRICIAESLFLLIMLVALFVPSDLASIAPWKQISFMAILRGVIWLLGSSLLPGLYLLRLTSFGTGLTRETRFAVAISLSFIIVGVLTLAFYCFAVDYSFLPWFILILLIGMSLTKWSHNPQRSKNSRQISRWRLLLIVIIALSILASFAVQVSQRYLIAGDMWVSLNPAVEIVSRRNVYQDFSSWEYPIMFGFMLGGLSICSGLPAVNEYVLLFPLIALNILSFFSVSRVLFRLDEKVSSIASVVYCFGGGLALLYQILVSNGQQDFWTASFYTMDAYFSGQFWNGMQFFHKTLALALAFVGLVTFVVAVRASEKKTQMTGLVFTALMLWTSFLVHVVEFLFFVPIIIGIAFICQEGKRRYVKLALLAVFMILFACVTDLLMGGYYYWLIGKKTQGFLSTLRVTTTTYIIIAAIAVTLGVVASWRIFFYGSTPAKKLGIGRLKYLLVVGLGLIYCFGLFFWSTPSTDVSYPFPWYLYVTRYGFPGFLALIGLAATSLKEESSKLAGYWCLIAIIMGSIWWGVRFNAFLLPVVAVFSAMGLIAIWKLADVAIHFPISMKGKKGIRGRIRTLGVKPLVVALILTLLVCSVSSFVYGVYFYTTSGPSIDDDTASAFAWIQQNTPENVTILVPDIYQVSKGVATIGDRNIYVNTGILSGYGADKFLNLTRTLNQLNIRYAWNSGQSRGQGDVLNSLLSYSRIAYQQGRVRIFELPPIKSSSSEYSVAVVDRQSLGLGTGNASFGWVDDTFTTGWYLQNMNVSRQEELLAFSWDFRGLDVREPSARKAIPIVNTSKYPYLFVRYRNTLDTSDTAENNIGQIITVANETGYPQGYVTNEYLPISRGSSFNIFVAKLPESQNIASIVLWMRNYQKLNGTVGLQIDYIGFSSNESVAALESKMSFLSMAIPALWPYDYGIVSDRGETKSTPIAVSLYDRDALDYTRESTVTRTYVFLNESAEVPSWGADWIILKSGIISGTVDQKRIVIIGVDSVRNDLLEIAKFIYDQISVQG